jgi:GrpB-like predicted nucleotidyltransferase (UPF0157 family)
MSSRAVRAITLVPYDPAWPVAFEAMRALVIERLGAVVAEVHHIGSTAIPGLAAKPKIDIDVVLIPDAVIADAAERLKPFDYEHHGDVYQDGMWCLTKSHGSFGERLYLCAPGNRVHLDRMRFRDWLRARPNTASAYGELKERLAAEAAGDWARYTRGKSAFVAEVLERATTGRGS